MQAFKSIHWPKFHAKINMIIQAIHMAKFNSKNDSKSTNDAKFKYQRTIDSMCTLHDKTQEEQFNKDV